MLKIIKTPSGRKKDGLNRAHYITIAASRRARTSLRAGKQRENE
jgi:hypothetical protein